MANIPPTALPTMMPACILELLFVVAASEGIFDVVDASDGMNAVIEVSVVEDGNVMAEDIKILELRVPVTRK